ncbi:MAG: helix-turn-helix domain-containing protein [Selenomonadaceae bacterium]|nr:helix-turn-helix domain-containing protein [Selenomonadaceae bacterium]
MNVLDEVMTVSEAARRWDKDVRTIRQACTYYKGNPPRFASDEVRQSGRTWLITLEGMERVYGVPTAKTKSVNVLDGVMTVAEAAERWGKASITVRQACTGYKKAPPRFREDEARRSGTTWLITVAGMIRVFGSEKAK